MIDGLISVIVPIYKSELFLEKCVDSILQQTYTNLEIILVDDGSPDKSGELCDSLADKDSRIKVLHKTNGGVCSARNAGIDIAKGEFVAFVDHDDTIEKNMYECMYNHVIEVNADICICSHTIYWNGYARTYSVPHKKIYTPVTLIEAFIDNCRYYGSIIGATNKLISNSLLQGEAGGSQKKPIRFMEDVKAGEDAWFIMDCLAAADSNSTKITFVNIPLYNHMAGNNPGSISKSFTFGDMDKLHGHLRKVMKTILPQKTDAIERALHYQECLYIVTTLQKVVLAKQKTEYRLTWKTVATVLKTTTRFETKLSALFVYLLPKPLYRFLFFTYWKLKNLLKRNMRSSNQY